MKSVPFVAERVVSVRFWYQAQATLKNWWLTLFCIVMVGFFATSSLAQAPGWSRGQQLLAISYDEGIRRSPLALQAEGYRIDYRAGAMTVGIKDIHTAVIMCNPAPEDKLWVNIVVASNGGGGGEERQRLQARMEQQLQGNLPPVNPPPVGTPSLRLDKTTFAPGADIKVYFTAPATYPNTAWIGLIPSNAPHGNEDVNDQNDVAYQYLGGKIEGSMTFKAPDAGFWDLRMNDRDGGGKEVASVSFTVNGAGNPPPFIPPVVNTPVVNPLTDGAPSLRLDKTTFAPGDEIVVRFKALDTYAENAWVGIIPSNIPHGNEDVNDQNDISYQYLGKKTEGTLTFKAPGAGAWDIRMNDRDGGGTEVASVSFVVQ